MGFMGINFVMLQIKLTHYWSQFWEFVQLVLIVWVLVAELFN